MMEKLVLNELMKEDLKGRCLQCSNMRGYVYGPIDNTSIVAGKIVFELEWACEDSETESSLRRIEIECGQPIWKSEGNVFIFYGRDSDYIIQVSPKGEDIVEPRNRRVLKFPIPCCTTV